jgi:hypothetical protein
LSMDQVAAEIEGIGFIKDTHSLKNIAEKTVNLPVTPAPKPSYSTITIATPRYDSGDLEAATKTVTATARPENADYTCTNNLTAPAYTKDGVVQPTCPFTILKVGFRLALDVDSLSVGSKLKAEVLINAIKPINAGEITVAGAGQALVGNLSLSSGEVRGLAAEIRLWKDVAGTGDTVVSKAQLLIAYGASGSIGNGIVTQWASLSINGLVQNQAYGYISGSGTFREHFGIPTLGGSSPALQALSGQGDYSELANSSRAHIWVGLNYIGLDCTVATSLAGYRAYRINILEF